MRSAPVPPRAINWNAKARCTAIPKRPDEALAQDRILIGDEP